MAPAQIDRALFALSLVVYTTSASAVTIDDFTTPQDVAVDASDDAAFATTTLNGPIAGTVAFAGGQRQLRVSKTNNARGSVESEIFPGAALYDALGSVQGQWLLEYNNFGSVDLSAFDSLTVTGSIDPSAASGPGATIGIFLEDGGANSSNGAFTLTTAGPFQQDIPLTDFAGVDLTDIGRIRLGSFDSNGALVSIPAGGDITLLRFEAVSAQVPEPPSLWLWMLLAACGFATARRRMRKVRGRGTCAASLH